MWPFSKQKKPKFNTDVERLVDQIYALRLNEEERCSSEDLKCLTHISTPVKITDTIYLVFGNSIALIRPIKGACKYDDIIVMSNSKIYYEGSWQKTIIPLLEMRLAELKEVQAQKDQRSKERLVAFGLKVE